MKLIYLGKNTKKLNRKTDRGKLNNNNLYVHTIFLLYWVLYSCFYNILCTMK